MIRPQFVGPWSVNKEITVFSFDRLKKLLSNVSTLTCPVKLFTFKANLRDHTHGFFFNIFNKKKNNATSQSKGERKENVPKSMRKFLIWGLFIVIL